jgi:uncharacterized repeat protein (TIGR02543 family)
VGGSNATLADDPGTLKKNGYTLTGWNTTAAAGGGTHYNFEGSWESIPVGEHELYAEWTPDYTDSDPGNDGYWANVTYDLNGGTGTVPAIGHFVAGGNATLASDPGDLKKDGYTAIGWNIIPSGGTETHYDFGEEWEDIIAGDYIIYVEWVANSHNIIFDKNAASATGSMMNMTIDYNETKALTSNGFNREGYTFAGWATSQAGAVAYANRANYTLTTDAGVTLYAVWQTVTIPAPVTFTVTFNDYDGRVIDIQTVSYGGNATAPQNPMRPDYTFAGWDIAFTNVTSNLIVTAQYEEIKEDIGGGDGGDTGDGEDPDDETPGGGEPGGGEIPGGGSAPVGYTIRTGNPAASETAQTAVYPNPAAEVTPGTGEVPPEANIDESETPLTGVDKNSASEEDNIAKSNNTGTWSLFDLLCTIIAVAVAIAGLIVMLARRKRSDEDDEYVTEYITRPVLLVIGIIAAAASIVTFVLTQNMGLNMAFFDARSVLFAAFAVASVLCVVFTYGKKRYAKEA